MNIATASSSAIRRASAGTRAFFPSAGARTVFGSTSIVVRSCQILRSCCRGPPRRAGLTWRAHPHSRIRRSWTWSTRPSLAVPCRSRAPGAGRWSIVRHRSGSGVGPPDVRLHPTRAGGIEVEHGHPRHRGPLRDFDGFREVTRDRMRPLIPAFLGHRCRELLGATDFSEGGERFRRVPRPARR